VDGSEFGFWGIGSPRCREFGCEVRLGRVIDGRLNRGNRIVHGGSGRVGREKRKCLHQLVALRYGYVAVVQLLGRFAVHVKPPVAFQYRLVEQGRLWAQETFLRQTVVSERAYVEHL